VNGDAANKNESETRAPGPEPSIAHRPVLLDEALEFLNVRPGGTYIDATLGGGGHAEAILERLTTGRLLGLDRDPAAVAHARERLAGYGERFVAMEGNFGQIAELHRASGFAPADGLLADLGLSSLQLDDAARGFSFNREGPLDMRMGPDVSTTAEEIVNYAGEKELADLIYKFSQERHSRRIARAIMKARPIRTTTELAQVVTRAIPSRAGLHQLNFKSQISNFKRLHPATRTFMALRLAVNGEMEHLQKLLAQALDVVAPAGRLVFITFHSLEDRPVKQALQGWKRAGRAQVLTRHVVRPSEEEVSANPRARSGKLRAAEKSN
jgi:16S rRNA (cytosine1402-N4)-methyltransferase